MIAQRMIHRQSWALLGGVVVILLLALLAYFSLAQRVEDADRTGDEGGAVGEETDGSPSSSEEAIARNVPFTTVARGQFGGSSERGFKAVTDENGLTVLLDSMKSSPSISADFSTTMIVAAFAGEKMTGGHTIEITGITEQEGMVTVGVVETRPGSHCIVTQAITNPYHIVLARQPHADVQFKVTRRVQECPE